MFGNRQLNRLEHRKATLLKRSGEHRAVFEAAGPVFRPVAGWVDTGVEAAHRARDGWAVLSPWFSRASFNTRESGIRTWTSRFRHGVGLVRCLLGIWRVWRK